MIKIVKWNETFENADSRKRQRLGIFYMPSGCDSSGYLSLMSEFPQDKALMAFGVFIALCQQSATLRKGVRGSFIKGDGSPMSEKQISMMIHVDVCHLRAAIEVLADKRVKWVELLEKNIDMPPICHQSASSVPQNSDFVQGEGEGEGEVEGEGEGKGEGDDFEECEPFTEESCQAMRERSKLNLDEI